MSMMMSAKSSKNEYKLQTVHNNNNNKTYLLIERAAAHMGYGNE